MSTASLLLDLTYRGQILRVATDAVDVYDSASATWLAYSPGIDALTVSLALDFLAASGALSVPVECILPSGTNPGAALAGCAATLSLWTDGDDYADRQVLASGVAVDPVWGEDGEAVSFSIARAATTSTALAIPATSRVDPTTWGATAVDIDPADLGVSYPTVFGRPGGATGTEWITGSQIVWVAYNPPLATNFVAILAGHPTNQHYVEIVTDGMPTGHLFAVWQWVDERGVEVSGIVKYADYPAAGFLTSFVDAHGNTIYGTEANATTTPALGAPVAVFANWARSPAGSEGDTGGLSPLAGDVIAYLLARAAIPVDTGRFAAAGPLLSGYRFDCVIDDGATKSLEWLQSNVYPLLPLSIASGPDGDYPIVWRYDATADDAIARLDADADPMISRAGKAKADSSKLANAFSLQYRYSVRTGSYTATLTRDKASCPYCAASERAHGRIEKAITTTNVYDAPTASAMLAWMARAYTSATVRIPYLVPSSYGLERGQVVLLTDSRMSYAAQVCLVSDVQIDGTGVDGVEFLIVPDYARD